MNSKGARGGIKKAKATKANWRGRTKEACCRIRAKEESTHPQGNRGARTGRGTGITSGGWKA